MTARGDIRVSRLRPFRPGKAGYTLTEMLVVAGIIIVVAGVSLPMLAPFFRGRGVSEAADIFKNACVTARSRAIQERMPFEVIVPANPREQSVQVRVQGWDSLPAGPDKNRLEEPKHHIPSGALFEFVGSKVYTYTFTSSGAVDTTPAAAGPLTFSIVDVKRERGKTLEIFSSTGQVASEEKAF